MSASALTVASLRERARDVFGAYYESATAIAQGIIPEAGGVFRTSRVHVQTTARVLNVRSGSGLLEIESFPPAPSDEIRIIYRDADSGRQRLLAFRHVTGAYEIRLEPPKALAEAKVPAHLREEISALLDNIRTKAAA